MNHFEEYIRTKGIDLKLLATDESTHTAQQAANAYNVPVSNIVKSLLTFVDGTYVLFLVPGDKRLDLESLGGRMANAQEVKEITGYSIGGVPPFGHKTPLKTIIVDGFKEREQLLAAGGKPNIIFKISYEKLKECIPPNC